ncbi:hypothetical protein [Plantactinospora sonchi]|uniref:DUF2975 domain-containing protein n=1 Tax=Plantactinospora sonchi TaxID=1544735 RepID=A0ABU7RZ34_9ACTN
MTPYPIQPRPDRDGDRRRAALGRAWMAAVLILMDLALLGLAGVVWPAVERGSVSGMSVWPILLVAGNALAGVLLLVVVGAANISAVRAGRAGTAPTTARGLGSLGQWLAVLRLVALLGTGILLAAATGLDNTGLSGGFLLGVGVFDAVLAMLLALRTGGAIRAGGARA